MSDFRKCKICGKFGWVADHKCPPKWEVNIPDYDPETWTEYYADDSETAANEAAEKYDIDMETYPLLNEGEIEVWVRKAGETKVDRYLCTGQPVPEYYTKRLT